MLHLLPPPPHGGSRRVAVARRPPSPSGVQPSRNEKAKSGWMFLARRSPWSSPLRDDGKVSGRGGVRTAEVSRVDSLASVRLTVKSLFVRLDAGPSWSPCRVSTLRLKTERDMLEVLLKKNRVNVFVYKCVYWINLYIYIPGKCVYMVRLRVYTDCL